MSVLFLIVGLVVGFLIAFVLNKIQTEKQNAEFAEKEKMSFSQMADLDKQKSILEAIQKQLQDDNNKLEMLLKQERETSSSQSSKIAMFDNENKNLLEKLQNQKTEIEELQKRLTVEFENIANKILKERSNEFSLSNEKNIGELLNPLKEKIASFEKKVEETYDKEFRDKVVLRYFFRSIK